MNFDEILEAWHVQDAEDSYDVSNDALRQVLATEDARVRRLQRRDMWIACIGGIGVTVLGGFWIAIPVYKSWPLVYTVAAGLGCGMVVVWLASYCLSYWRQAKSERIFGNTIQEELQRTLNRVELEISRYGTWRAAMMQIAPPLLGALLISWSIDRSQSDITDAASGRWSMYLLVMLAAIYLVRAGQRRAKQNLEPRRQRLRELLAALESRE